MLLDSAVYVNVDSQNPYSNEDQYFFDSCMVLYAQMYSQNYGPEDLANRAGLFATEMLRVRRENQVAGRVV